jgi:hypothetical protein
MVCARDINNTACFRFLTATATSDGEIDLVSFGPDEFVLNWARRDSGCHQSRQRGSTRGYRGRRGHCFGVGRKSSTTERQMASMTENDASAASVVALNQRAKFVIGHGTSPPNAADFEADLSASASWPTDGFQLNFTD